MPWIQLKIDAQNDNAEAISDELLELGALSVTFVDRHDTPVFEPKPGETLLWSQTVVLGLFDASTDMQPILQALSAQGIINANNHILDPLEDKDWEREWMKDFHPMRFGQRLWICPSWTPVPDPSAVNVMLDPGLAFGTGTHATTALCLRWLDSLDLSGKTVLDFGCGSGILAIAALKLGAERVIGIDIDPQAIQASLDNAQRNGVSDKIELYLPQDHPQDFVADVVVANILAAPLRELVGPILANLKPSGVFALSGILEEQADSVAQVYKDFASIDPIEYDNEWCRITGTTHKA
ncbi:50S ribosomal protein L11 methyltransferase [Alginatibacterium sediminis]|uniref:Ribosomal protein L11 methyltransferase n=1 Tax=Alginatibacterium sediminis TaxID=2164068 RepID=A0A420E7J6_9ALTE|nr:50S ribosomal protein L11 methyltransferase [Alginatibacterium sediminis]RKF14464.1 50S ribosomal protein L11 methyltransferase [Alginatibacterium sediminis]